MNISAAIIGRNSTKTLEYTLLSLRGICNQVVFVDTGSDDGTPELATRLGAEVYFLKWKNDFALARNFALQFVRNDWTLVIDTDEILTEFDSESIKEQISNNPKIFGFNVTLKNYLNKEDLNQYSTHKYTRLFRKHPAILFSGKIHEQIRQSIENLGMEVAESSIVIEHFGYMEKSEEKQSRNMQILENEVAQNKDDVFLKYHLAQTEFSMKNFNRAKDIFLDIVKSPLLTDEQIALTRIRLGQILINENKFSEAEQFLLEPIKDNNLDGFRIFVLAAVKMSQHQFATSLELYKNPNLLKSSYVDKNIVDKAIEALKQIIT